MKTLARFALIAFLLSFVFALAQDTKPQATVTIDKAGVTASLKDGRLIVNVPIARGAAPELFGAIGIEVTDFDGRVLGRNSTTIKQAEPQGKYLLSIPTKLTPADAHKTIIRIMARTNAGDTMASVNLFEVLQRIETRLYGQNEFLAGSRASVRVVTIDQRAQQPVSAKVVISARYAVGAETRENELFRGETGKDGTAQISFILPETLPMQATLMVRSASADGSDELQQPITLKSPVKILLTSDKPLYQPGQLMHIRALALRTDNQQPIANTDATIEVLDAKGNKVFKKVEKTDAFGIIATDFSLASECIMGDYKIRASVAPGGDPNAQPITSEKDVAVKRYVLPKFKPILTTDKQFYRPGETVKGEVQADYFFGKPVARAEVMIKIWRYDVGWSKFQDIVGRTDDKGHYSFELRLPDRFVGQPFEQGNARVRLDIDVRDEAEHTESITQSRTVAKDAINIVAIPESGRLVPGLENKVFVMTTYPDGSPAKCKVALPETKQTQQTDDLGVATFTIKPELKAPPAGGQAAKEAPQPMRPGRMRPGFARPVVEDGGEEMGKPSEPEGEPFSVKITAEDAKGNKGDRTLQLSTEAAAIDTLLARLSQSLAKVGDKLTLDVFTTRKAGTVYVDVIKNRQTMATYSLETKDSRGTMELPLSADLTGSVQVHCYLLDSSGDTVRDTKLLFVSPADDLRIETKVSGSGTTPTTKKGELDSFKPGEDSKLDFTVTDSKGHPVLAALGVVIVDEAVFALQEMQPGLEKVYFLLEQEIMKPRYEIHGQSLDDIVRPLPMPMPMLAPAPALPGARELTEQEKEHNQRAQDATNERVRRQQAARVLFAAAEALYNHSVNISSGAKGAEAYLDAAMNKIKTDFTAVEQAIRQHEQAAGKWPRNAEPREILQPLVDKGTIKASNMFDPWGEPYSVSLQIERDRVAWIQFKWADGSYFMNQWNFNLVPRFAKSLGLDAEKLQNQGRIFGAVKFKDDINGMILEKGGARPQPPMAMRALAMDAAPMAGGGQIEMQKAQQQMQQGQQGGGAGATAAPEPRIRQFFPETLFFAPSVITDAKGKASVPLALADSITTWRLSAMGNAANGMLGSTTAPIRVFQDFFVDIDLPVTLTQGDQVSIPVAVYNYLKEPQEVRLELSKEAWFEIPNPKPGETADKVVKTKKLDANAVGVVYFDLRVVQLGWHKLTIKAFGSKLSDAVRREIEVVPNGQEQLVVLNDSLNGDLAQTVTIPENAIADASKILVKIYPGIFSQMLEGLDGMLQMPGGCFEQTSSTLYPNILILDYLKQTKQAKPDIQMKAEGFINHGYQRLLTFEVQGGGFEWFGNAPANQILTAWGVMQFRDMARVYPSVDPAIITRTQNWLVSRQNQNGTWSPDKAYLHAESWGKIQGSDLLVTSYITWGLLESGYRGPAVDKAVKVLKDRLDEAKDPYMLALVAQALVAWNKDAKETIAVLDTAAKIAVPAENDAICWKPQIKTACYGHGDASAIETTAMFAQAFTKAGRHPDVVTKALAYLTKKKDARGAWGSTQATIQALKAFNLALAQAGKETDAIVTVLVNGKEAQKLKITPADSDVLRLVDCGAQTKAGENKVELKFEGKGAMLYQIVGRYYMPWDIARPILPVGAQREPMEIAVAYDKDKLETEDVVTAKVSVKNNTGGAMNMVVVDLGVPPGFQVQTDALDELVGNKVITRYDMTGRQIILYFEKIGGNQTVDFSYQLKAKFPVVVSTPRSRAYAYYNPEQQGIAKPKVLAVKAK